MTYRGYQLERTTTGGKAGRGQNATASIKILKPLGFEAYQLIKYVRYKTGDSASFSRALTRAMDKIDELTGLEKGNQ